MQLSKNTSVGASKRILIKFVMILVIVVGSIIMLDKIDFPSPNKEIEKIITK